MPVDRRCLGMDVSPFARQSMGPGYGSSIVKLSSRRHRGRRHKDQAWSGICLFYRRTDAQARGEWMVPLLIVRRPAMRSFRRCLLAMALLLAGTVIAPA